MYCLWMHVWIYEPPSIDTINSKATIRRFVDKNVKSLKTIYANLTILECLFIVWSNHWKLLFSFVAQLIPFHRYQLVRKRIRRFFSTRKKRLHLSLISLINAREAYWEYGVASKWNRVAWLTIVNQSVKDIVVSVGVISNLQSHSVIISHYWYFFHYSKSKFCCVCTLILRRM